MGERSPGVVAALEAVPAASLDGGPVDIIIIADDQVASVAGGATDRPPGAYRWGSAEAIWHSNVPGTSPISGLFEARRRGDQAHKLRKVRHLRQNRGC